MNQIVRGDTSNGSALNEVGGARAATPSRGDFDHLAQLAAAALGTPAAMLVRRVDGGEVCKGAYGVPASFLALYEQAAAPSLLRPLADTPLAVGNTAEDPRFAAHPAFSSSGFVAVLSVPLDARDSTAPAYLAVLDTRPRDWHPDDQEVLSIIGQAAAAEVGVAQLTTALSRADAEARRQRLDKEALLNGIPYGAFVLDAQGRIALLNAAAARFFQLVSGTGTRDLLGSNLWQDCPEVADSTFAKACRQAEADNRSFQSEAYFPRLRRWFTFEGTYTAGGMCVVLRDITRRTQLERTLRARAEELSDANRGKEEFLVQLAHDLRNCLTPIQNALHLTSVPGEADALLREALAIAGREVQHISRMLADLLRLAHLAPSTLQPKSVPLELGQLVGKRVHATTATPEAHGYRFTLDLPSEGIVVEGDPDLLEQVLEHLLDNALKFTPPGGHITVAVARDQDEAVLRVSDDGVGIAPDMLPRVFDVFMRPDHRQTRTQGGVGIGLSLVRRFLALHHGRIEAHSAGIGCGAEFVARLPIVSAAVPVSAPETAVAKPPSEAPQGKPGHILVVDDNRHAAQTLGMLLQRWGYEVRIAFDPFTALEEAGIHAPWVVLLDIGMPGMDGYEVARRLRSQPESRAAHLIALTGYGEDEDRRRAESAGFDYHLLKPAAPDDLHKLLRKLAAAVGTPERPAP